MNELNALYTLERERDGLFVAETKEGYQFCDNRSAIACDHDLEHLMDRIDDGIEPSSPETDWAMGW